MPAPARIAFGLLSVLLLLTETAPAATRVPLVVDEPAPQRAVAWPLTTGVPFPRGGLAQPEQCRLVDDTGAERPLQSRVTATWDAERTSIRWLTIDFIAEPGRTYALEFGPEIQRQKFPTPLEFTHTPNGEVLRMATGPLAAEFSLKGPSALASVAIDANRDGKIESTEVVATGDPLGDHYYLTTDGRRFSNAGDATERTFAVEVVGPVRACVRVDGFYTGPKGERIVSYRTRYHFFAGLGLMKLVDEFRVVGSTRETRFQDVGLSLKFPPGGAPRTIAADASGDAGNQIVSVDWTPDLQSVSSFQSTYRHFGNPEYEAAVVADGPFGERRLAQPDRIGEWLQVNSAAGTVTGSLRNMWQQFPKEWEATADGLTLHLWSPRGGELDFGIDGVKRFIGEVGKNYVLDWKGVRPGQNPLDNFFFFAGRAALENGGGDGLGTNKHHEVFLHFAPPGESAVGATYGSLAARPPLALATGEWNCSTDVFGPLAPRPNNSPYERIVDYLFELGRKAQDDFGDYGWWTFGSGPHYSYQWDAVRKRHYADPRRFEYHTYQKETQLWWNYLRSGERKFYDWAIPSEDHWVDIAVSHAATECDCAWRGGEPFPRRMQWAPGDWSIDSPLHYVRHHDNAEAWLRGASQFWGSYHRTLETTTLAYYITGDERYNDVIAYWRDYWGTLAGKTNAATDLAAWYQEQAWWEPLKPGEKPQTWAELIRNYAPFRSGSRHQMTLFFSLATLYEHTWDPAAGQALKEYSDAFLDPAHPIGIWRSQDNSLPSHHESPQMLHYWSPALWKYARVTRDPRMPDVFRRLYDAAYFADPFRESGEVGVYSNTYAAYGFYHTKNPGHLRLAQLELDQLVPHGLPLARPEELGPRIYNPYALALCFAGIPRLTWALNEGARTGVQPPPVPLVPQRVPLAFAKAADKPLRVTLWGFDSEVKLFGPDGSPAVGIDVQSRRVRTDLSPFDRTPATFEASVHEVTIPAAAPAGWFVAAPHLELGVIDWEGTDGLLTNAARPVSLRPGQVWRFTIPAGASELRLETARPAALRVTIAGQTLAGKTEPNALLVPLPAGSAGKVVEIAGSDAQPLWFQIAGLPEEACWGTFHAQMPLTLPSRAATLAALPEIPAASAEPFVAGRFGQAAQLTPGKVLSLPDHLKTGDQTKKLFDERQGTIEFWIRRDWDERLAPSPGRPTFVTNGVVSAFSPWKLPLREWAHVAVVWAPAKRDPSVVLVYIYVNGLDQANYRSTWWAGYGDRPYGFSVGKWLEEFRIQAPPGGPFAIDELRVSSTPRYIDLTQVWGNRQTFNPVRFQPPTEPFTPDPQTLILNHFDGNLEPVR